MGAPHRGCRAAGFPRRRVLPRQAARVAWSRWVSRVGETARVFGTTGRGQQHDHLGMEGIKPPVLVHDFGNIVVEVSQPKIAGRAVDFQQVFQQIVQRIEAVAAENREA